MQGSTGLDDNLNSLQHACTSPSPPLHCVALSQTSTSFKSCTVTSTNAASDLVLQATATDPLFTGTLFAATFPSGASSGKLLRLQKSAAIDVASVRAALHEHPSPTHPWSPASVLLWLIARRVAVI